MTRLWKFAHLFILPILLVTGCVKLEHSADYSKRKTVAAFPVVNSTDRKIFKSDTYDERVYFPSYVRNYVGANKRVVINELSDRGYTLVLAHDARLGQVTPDELAHLRKGRMPASLRGLPFDYALVASLDRYEIVELGISRRFHVTLYLVDTRAGKVTWSGSSVESFAHLPLLKGPFLSTLEASGIVDGSTRTAIVDPVAATIQNAIGACLADCPLLTSS